MKKFLTAALAASLTITLTACNPVSLLNQLLVDENANDPKIESAAEQRREELEGKPTRNAVFTRFSTSA